MMEHEQQCDVAMFRVWPIGSEPYGQEPAALKPPEAKMQQAPPRRDDAARREDVVELLNEMTIELKAHFQFFKMLREKAVGEMPEGQEPDGKLIRADMKAASDALSLIVRTLEKIDELQRQMAKERDLALDVEAESEDYDKAVSFFLDRIEALAEEKFKQRWQAFSASP